MRKCLILAVLLLISLSSQAQQRRSTTIKKQRDLAIDAHHVVSFSPFGFLVAYDRFNPAIGFDYEYILSQEAGIGIRFPFAFGYSGPEEDFGSGSTKHTTLYAAPGVRFHAPIRRGAAEFATGPAIILGNMHFKPYDNGFGGPVVQPYDYNLTGIMADNSLNFFRGNFMFGFDFRVGTMIKEENDSRFFIHLGMHFGGKF